MKVSDEELDQMAMHLANRLTAMLVAADEISMGTLRSMYWRNQKWPGGGRAEPGKEKAGPGVWGHDAPASSGQSQR